MTNVIIPGLAVTCIRSTGEQALATIIGRSTREDDFIHLKYMRNVFEGKQRGRGVQDSLTPHSEYYEIFLNGTGWKHSGHHRTFFRELNKLFFVKYGELLACLKLQPPSPLLTWAVFWGALGGCKKMVLPPTS